LKEVKRAAGYIRVSTVEQSLKGLSIETQIAEIEAYAKQHKMKLEGIYIDRGITARKSLENRVDFMRMMKDVESGKINHIIVLRLDRFFRNVYDYHKMMNEYLEPNNCDWSAVKESYTTETTNGRLMINLRLSIAEQECDTDSDRIKDVLAHRASQGFAVTGAMPWRLTIVDHRVVPDPEKHHIIQDMFKQMELCCSVRKTNILINNKYGINMSYSTMLRILKNPLYCGEFRGMLDYCVPSVPREQFLNVQRLIKMNVKVRKNKNTYVFTGLLRCAHCGNKMTGNRNASANNNWDYKYYRCNKAKQNKMCDNQKLINQNTIEEYLLNNVEKLLADYIYTVEVKEKQNAPKIKSNRKAIEKKLQRLNDLYVDGFIDMEKYKSDYEFLKSQIIEDTQEEKKDLAALKEFLESDFKNIYSTLDDTQKLSLWRRVIKEIKVSGNEVVEVVFL
jgi:DNA invertase Pin-like site-specific DNA recombinase